MSAKNAREALLSGDFGRQTHLNISGVNHRERQLLQAQNEMQIELERLRSAEAVVSATSSAISSIHSKYGTYQSRIASASNALRILKTKMEKDDRYIYWSYMIFLMSAGWIFLKRVKAVAIMRWFANNGLTGISWMFQYNYNATASPDMLTNLESMQIITTVPSAAPTIQAIAIAPTTTSTTRYTMPKPARASTALTTTASEKSADSGPHILEGLLPSAVDVLETSVYPDIPAADEL